MRASAQRIRAAAVSGWSPYSAAQSDAQPCCPPYRRRLSRTAAVTCSASRALRAAGCWRRRLRRRRSSHVNHASFEVRCCNGDGHGFVLSRGPAGSFAGLDHASGVELAAQFVHRVVQPRADSARGHAKPSRGYLQRVPANDGFEDYPVMGRRQASQRLGNDRSVQRVIAVMPDGGRLGRAAAGVNLVPTFIRMSRP